jgi:predicted transcriptional regulator
MPKRVPGRHHLQAWMRQTKLNQASAALALGLSQAMLSYLLAGKRCPGLSNGLRIQRVTGIVISSWEKDIV